MSIISIADYNVVNLDRYKRDSIRAELAEMHERLPADGLSATISAQVLETALYAIDAINRVEDLAEKFDADEGPARAVAYAFALEIRTALKGA